MSYILEALKKSQQERGRGQVPDLQSLHQPLVASEVALPRWPYWALAACVLALVFLLGWLRPWQAAFEVEPASVDAAVVSKAPIAAPVIEPMAATTTVPSPIVESPAKVQAVTAKTAMPESIPDIHQLPAALQQTLPELTFAGHVYSSNPQQRSVIINGRAMAEGDALMPGMVLRQITADSVIFDYQQQLFRVTVLQGWSFK